MSSSSLLRLSCCRRRLLLLLLLEEAVGISFCCSSALFLTICVTATEYHLENIIVEDEQTPLTFPPFAVFFQIQVFSQNTHNYTHLILHINRCVQSFGALNEL